MKSQIYEDLTARRIANKIERWIIITVLSIFAGFFAGHLLAIIIL